MSIAVHDDVEGLGESLQEGTPQGARSRMLREQYLRNERLLDALSDERNCQGVSQRELARRMHTGQTQVSRLESGELDPRLSTLARYAASVNVEIRYQLVRVSEHAFQASQMAGFPVQVEGYLMPTAPTTGAPCALALGGQGMPLAANVVAPPTTVGGAQIADAMRRLEGNHAAALVTSGREVMIASRPQRRPGSLSGQLAEAS